MFLEYIKTVNYLEPEKNNAHLTNPSIIGRSFFSTFYGQPFPEIFTLILLYSYSEYLCKFYSISYYDGFKTAGLLTDVWTEKRKEE